MGTPTSGHLEAKRKWSSLELSDFGGEGSQYFTRDKESSLPFLPFLTVPSFFLSFFVVVYPFVGVSTVTKMCSSICVPSDVDGIGMTRPVSCCYSDLCNTDGAASLRISFVPIGILASSLCAFFWTRLWGADGEVFQAEELNEEDNKPLPAQLSVWMPHEQPSTAPRTCFF